MSKEMIRVYADTSVFGGVFDVECGFAQKVTGRFEADY